MRPDTLTRLRNAFARVALELLEETPAATGTTAFSPPFSSMTEADWRRAVQLWRQHAPDLIESLPLRPCPACGSAGSRWLFESYDAHAFHECDACGCWFTPRLVDWAVFERLFERCPEAREHARQMMSSRDQQASRESDMSRIGGYLDELLPLIPRHADHTLAYLDAGCGVGHSLRAGLARGLRVQGIEVDQSAVELARADGLPVMFLSDASALPQGPYQLLSFWETLEHIAAPLQAIERFTPYLADEGLVAITVPNLNAPAARMLREACAWVHGGYNTPGHVNLFHVPALERLLARASLSLLDSEGQFSGNPLELAAYLAGATRGAFDALDPSLPRGALPRSLGDTLAAVWPGLALIEQLAQFSPVLKIVACKRGRESIFAEAIAARRAQRRVRLAEQARELIAYEVDYEARSAALQHEVNRRDELLVQERARYERTLDARLRAGVRTLGRLARGPR